MRRRVRSDEYRKRRLIRKAGRKIRRVAKANRRKLMEFSRGLERAMGVDLTFDEMRQQAQRNLLGATGINTDSDRAAVRRIWGEK